MQAPGQFESGLCDHHVIMSMSPEAEPPAVRVQHYSTLCKTSHY